MSLLRTVVKAAAAVAGIAATANAVKNYVAAPKAKTETKTAKKSSAPATTAKPKAAKKAAVKTTKAKAKGRTGRSTVHRAKKA